MGSSDNATTGVPVSAVGSNQEMSGLGLIFLVVLQSRPPMGTVIQGEGGGPAPCANSSSPEHGADVPPVSSGGSPTPADNDAGEPSGGGPPPVSSGDAFATQVRFFTFIYQHFRI
jgi:hypothetical protein